MGDQVPGDESVAGQDPSQTVPVVVLAVMAVLIVLALVVFCVMKKKKNEQKEAKLEDGEVQEELITANSQQNQLHATPDLDSQLKQGVREAPTNGITPTFEFPSLGNPEHKKWYESKAIPFMDASVGSIPEATNGERV